MITFVLYDCHIIKPSLGQLDYNSVGMWQKILPVDSTLTSETETAAWQIYVTTRTLGVCPAEYTPK